ncbi:MAG TPA: hypothetical protein VMM12_07180 [Longimicrobiales bacterium]|nr:hypothetical protein [Longimicrobiales bacterium]
MNVRINSRITSQLLDRPETGMGWQMVEFRMGYDRSLVLILNGEVAVERAGRLSMVREGFDPLWLRRS